MPSNGIRLQTELKNIVEQSEEMQHRLTKIVGAVIATKQTFLAAGGPVPTCEVTVPADSHVLGKNLVELKFWHGYRWHVSSLFAEDRM
jgi:K+/H+ antiporter YhaU regulatory subunit KhtT